MKRTLIVVSLFSTLILYSSETQKPLANPDPSKQLRATGLKKKSAQNSVNSNFCPCPACLILGPADQPYTWKSYARAGSVLAVVYGLEYLNKQYPDCGLFLK